MIGWCRPRSGNPISTSIVVIPINGHKKRLRVFYHAEWRLPESAGKPGQRFVIRFRRRYFAGFVHATHLPLLAHSSTSNPGYT
jgi:hypothetical protein